ncbi:MAG: FtsW/RodA/SpoVE family cell cycle protein [Patescibacteria group bacterium]
MSFIVSVLVSFIGVATIFGVTYKNVFNEIDYLPALKQFSFLILSIILYFFVSNVKFVKILNFSWIFYIFSIILLGLVFVVGTDIFGSKRWIFIGPISIQPSEFAKLSLAILFSYLSEKFFRKSDLLKLLLISVFVLLIPFLMIYFQPDFGTSLILIVIGIAFLLNSPNIPSKFIKNLIIIFIFITPFGWFFLKDYQKERVYEFTNAVFLGKDYDPNVQKSLEAIVNGGIFGKGLGFGPDSVLKFLPSRQTDFIVAVTFESYGLVGGSLIFLLYLFLIFEFWSTIPKMETRGAIVFATCTASFFTFQTLVNIGVNFGILPVTGIPAPFLSSGGSSLMVNFLFLGVLSSASKDKVFETTTVDKNDLEFTLE